MKTIIKIKKNKFWKIYSTQKYKFWFKGYFDTYTPKQVSKSLDNIDISEIDIFIKSLKGHFALVFKNRRFSLLVVDSTPLHFSKIKNDFHITNNSNILIKNKYFKKGINKSAIEEISMAGFVIDSKSIYSNIVTPLAGEYFIFSNDKVIKRSYFSYFGKISKKKYSILLKDLTNITVSIFQKLLNQIGNRQIIIPLSAGNDSRLVASILYHLGAKNVKCYSYGQKNNFESKTSKEIAKKLNYDWIFVPLKHHSEIKFYNSIEYKKFLEFSENHSSIPFVQSLSTFKYLNEKKFINKNSVFINGNSGDFISGAHINKLYAEIKNINNKIKLKESILNNLIEKHFSLWGNLKTEHNIKSIKSKLWSSISKECKKLNSKNAHLFYEYSEFIDRQSKYVISGQRVYEFHGYDWRLPLWDDEYLFFWKKI